MAKTKKVIALVLAFMMIFSSVSVLANAFDPTTGGSTLTVTAQIYKNDGTEWVACDKVTAGESVKVRVSIGTDYYSNLSDLIFFYDNTFFGDSYATGIQSLTVNDSAFSSSCFTKSASGIINNLISDGCLTSDYLSTHNYFVVSLEGPYTNYQYDGSDWLFEFDLNVLSNAAGDGAFEVLESTVQKTSNPYGYFNVPKGGSGEDSSTIYDMFIWYNGTVNCTTTVTTDSSITLNPAGGEWADGTSVAKTFNGETGEAFTRPELSYSGKTLAGWYDSSIANATLADCTYGPVGPTSYSEDEDLDLTAFWIDQVGATFSYNYDGSPADVVDPTATPGYPVGLDLNGDSIVPAVPARQGYEFRGWSTDAAASPQSANLLQNFDGMVYGNEGVTYYMIWAKAVTVEFFDTHDNSSLGTFSGYAGDNFTATAPTAPTYTGYSNVAGEGNFIPAAPSVFPDSDTTYNAIYEANSYIVNYIIYSAKGAPDTVFTFSRSTAYGAEIQTDVRYTAPRGKTLYAWFTDSACETALASGATLNTTSNITIYGYLDDVKYEVKFFSDSTQIGETQYVPFGGTITAPADPTKDGYVFAGWTPSIVGTGVLDTAADRTYTATWELDPDLKEYFYLDDGSAYETIDNIEGDPFEVPADPYKTGYSFDGWAATQGGTPVQNLPSVMPDTSTYYYAVFSPNNYYVIFDADNGYFDGNANITQKAVSSEFDSAIVLPASDPERTGYEFQGWAATSGGSVIADLGNLTVETDTTVENDTIVPGDSPLIYYAVWEIQSYPLNIAYVMSDGNDAVKPADVVDQMIVYGEDYNVASPDVTGYTPDIAAVSGTMDENGYTTTVTYTPNDYALNITYVMSDGNNDVKPADVVNQMVTYNTAYSVTSPDVTGYTPDIAVVSGTMDENGYSATVTYSPVEYALNITYVMADGNDAVKPADVVNSMYAYNTAFNVTSPDVTGYTPDIAAVSGTMDENGYSATVTYTPNDYALNITYVMSDGNNDVKPADVVNQMVTYNTAYSVTSPDVTGYTPDIAVVSGTMDENGYSTTVTYTPNAHTVTWVLDGGNIGGNAGPIVENKAFGDAITAPGTPDKYGYTFSAWTPAPAATVADEDYEYTATYTPNNYNATFVLEGGKYNNSTNDVVVPVAFDSAINALDPEPTKDGYTFQGWAATSGGAVLSSLGTMDTTDGYTFYAVWLANNATYYIDVYRMDTDGSYPSTPTQSYPGADGVHTGDTVTAIPADYLTEGFTFDSANASNLLSDEIPGTGTLRLQVYYSRDQHDIAFISEGNPVDTITDVYYGATANALTAADVQKTGYILEGWSLTSGGSVDVLPGDPITMGTSDLTYYAVWSPDQVNITVHEKYINLTNNTETVTDKTFTGTADAHAYIVDAAGADATAKYILFSELDQVLANNYAIDPANANNVLDGVIAADGSLELTVWYSPVSKTLTYNPNTGNFAPGTPDVDADGNLVETYTYYDEITLTSIEPAKTGYTFRGWARTASATQPAANIAGSHIVNDMTVYAVWEINSYNVNVTYVMSDGTQAPAAVSQPYQYGEEYSIATPALTGYTPDKDAVAGTMGAADVNETVTYTPNNYPLNITYVMSDGNTADKPADVVNEMHAYNSTFSVASPAVPGYEVDTDVVSGTMDDINGKSYTVTYSPIAYTLTINYVDGNGAAIAAADTVQVPYNGTYNIPAPSFTGYTLAQGQPTAITGTMDVIGGKSETVVYDINNYGLTINYLIDGTTTYVPTIATNPYTANLNYGEAYSVDSPANVEGYTLKAGQPATVSGTMGTEPIVVDVYYTVNVHSLTINYVDGDGAPVATAYSEQVAYGETYSVTSPDLLPNYRLNDDAQAVIAGTMGDADVTETVVYVLNSVTVEFRAPVRLTDTTNYGKLDYDNTVLLNTGATEYVIGTAITAPSAADTAITYYVFKGWTATPITGITTGNPDATLAEIGNASQSVVYYAVYERELVYLDKLDADATTVIDRNGKDIGYWAANYTAANFPTNGSALWFVTGIAPGRLNATTFTSRYVKAHGDGEVSVTRGPGGYGTGTLITVTDKVTGAVVEEFYVVIYGDIDGNGQVNATDLTGLKNEVAGKTTEKWSRRGTYVYYKVKAADLYNPNMSRISINSSDSSALSNVNAGKATLDQQTGVVTYPTNNNP